MEKWRDGKREREREGESESETGKIWEMQYSNEAAPPRCSFYVRDELQRRPYLTWHELTQAAGHDGFLVLLPLVR